MFITALLVIAKSLEATKMTFSKQMDKLIQPDKDYYSVVKRNELSSHENTQGNLKCILLHATNQSEKATPCMIPSIGHSGIDKTYSKEISFLGGEERGREG